MNYHVYTRHQTKYSSFSIIHQWRKNLYFRVAYTKQQEVSKKETILYIMHYFQFIMTPFLLVKLPSFGHNFLCSLIFDVGFGIPLNFMTLVTSNPLMATPIIGLSIHLVSIFMSLSLLVLLILFIFLQFCCNC